MLSTQLKQYLIVGLFLITGYLLFLPQASLSGVFFFPVLPVLFILQVDDLIGCRRKTFVSRPVFTTTDLVFILLFIAELVHPYFFPGSLRIQRATENVSAVILIYLGGRAYLYHTGLKWLAYGVTLIGVIVAISLVFTCYGFYGDMVREGFLPGEIVSLRYLLSPNGVMINDWAGILLVFLPFSIYTFRHLPRFWKFAALPGPFIISIAIVYTLSRGAILAWIFFTLVLIIAAIWCRTGFPTRLGKWILAGCVVSFVLCLTPVSEALNTLTITDDNSVQMQSVAGRFDRWEHICRLITEHPWTGIGNGNYGQVSMIISNQTGTPYTGRVNNLLMQLALEKGFPGLAIYVALLIVLFFRTIRHIRTLVKSGKRSQAFIPVVLLAGLCMVLIREMTFTTLLQQPVSLYFTILLILMLSFPGNSRQSSGYFMPLQQVTLVLALLLWFTAARSGQVSSPVSRYNSRAIAAIEQGDRKASLQNADLAIAADPENPVLRNNKALFLVVFDSTLADLGRYAAGDELLPPSQAMREALTLFETAATLAPGEPMFRHNAGWARLASGDTITGKRYLEQALRLAPYTPQYIVSLGVCQERSGNLTDAVELYTRALVVSPALINSTLFRDFARRHPSESLHVTNAASTQLKKQADQAGDYKSLAKWAVLRQACGDTADIVQVLETVVRRYPNLNRTWSALGCMYELIDPNKASRCFHKAYILDKWDPLVTYRLGKFYEANGDTNRSAEYYRKALYNRRYVIPEQTQRLCRIYGTLFWTEGYYPRSLSEAVSPEFE